MRSALPSKTRLLGVFSLLFISFFLMAQQVGAAGIFCRSDPVVILSNGVVMDFGASIETLPWNVQEVHYELHVPVGVNLIASIHTPTWIGTVESFTFYADQPPGQYVITTIVETRADNVRVNLDATLVSLALKNLRVGLHTSPGFENQLVTLLLNL
jgi:hypothetical protein